QAGRWTDQLRSLERREHDRLARQPDGPRAPRDRDPPVQRATPGVFSGWAVRRRGLFLRVVSPGAGVHPHLPAARQAGDPDDRVAVRLDRRTLLHARWQADRRGAAGYVDRVLGCGPDGVTTLTISR